MDPPTITIPIATPVDPTSKSSNSPTTIAKLLKGRTNYEKGSHYLQLSLATLNELASLSAHERLSASQKASCAEAYRSGRILSEETIKIRNQLLTQKKSFRKFLVNLFVRESKTKHFYKISYRNYSSIRRTSDDLNRLLLSEIDTILRNLGESAQCNESVTEEGPGRCEGSYSAPISHIQRISRRSVSERKHARHKCECKHRTRSTRGLCDARSTWNYVLQRG
ncbi:hypothetical protein DEU56DRAFT_776159 [Suillus clintonianus]|uniref:uncharacterized protein n=1 Tax=Suillus clintonianus TaxID=1904413 RepID=UPI001B874B53|nr:uncharacterized protein DEU56DRAFT_776159 [Suillus clintonianus]KAG2152793.1 hypothetical protein DEU56DRAFT_776159 [Suillus clintonianus]